MTVTVERTQYETTATNTEGTLLVLARLDKKDTAGPGDGFGDTWIVQPGLLLRERLNLESFYVRNVEIADAWVEFIADAWERREKGK